jgi:TP901 family phage tail tape measure protein
MADNKLSLIVQFLGQDNLSGALRNIIGLGRTGDQALKGMFRQARDLKGEMKGVAAEIAKGTGNVTSLIEKERQLAAELAKVNTQIDRQKRLNAFSADTARIDRRGDQLQSSGKDNLVGGAGLAAPLILAGKAAMDFSSGMVDIQQKAELSNAETAKMATNILNLARAAHQLPEDMRSGVDVLAGFGLDPRQAVEMIGPIGRLGTAFKVDLADGAGAAYANLNNLKVPLAQTGKALDIMAAGGKAGAFEVKDMARWFPQLTANLQALGETGTPAVADLTAALQMAMNTAGNADEAANNIANLLGKINSPTVIAAFSKKFGVDLPAAMAKFQKQGMSSMEAFAAATQKATGGDTKKLGWVLEDRQAQMGVLALIQNMDKYRTIRQQIATGSGGTVDAAFGQREAQDASIAWSSFRGTLSELAITLGATLLPSATAFFGTVNTVIQSVSSWARANPGLASGLATLAVSFVGLKIGLGALQFGFGSVLKTVATARTVFTQASTIFGVLRTAAMFLAQGVMRAGLMMMANPLVAAIVIIGVVIAGVAYLVYTHWDKIKAAFTTGKAWVLGVMQALPGQLQAVGGMMMQGLLAMIDPFGLRNRLLEVARNGVAAFKNFFGIKSPSRLFMEMGGHMTTGLAMGIDRGGRHPLGSMGRLAAGVAGAGALALSGPSLASARPTGGPGGFAAGKIEIHIHQQPGESAEDLADRVIKAIERKKRRKRGSSFEDDF